jgi:hypothetical protein
MALYDFHARMYDPVIGRWLVPDPAEQHFSLYLAMGNNPMSMVDPDGMWAGDNDYYFDQSNNLQYVYINSKPDQFWKIQTTGYQEGFFGLTYLGGYNGQGGSWLPGLTFDMEEAYHKMKMDLGRADISSRTYFDGYLGSLVKRPGPSEAEKQALMSSSAYSQTKFDVPKASATTIRESNESRYGRESSQAVMGGGVIDLAFKMYEGRDQASDYFTAGLSLLTLGKAGSSLIKGGGTLFQKHHIIPNAAYSGFKTELKAMGWVQNNSLNLKKLPVPFHGNHPAYNKFIINEMRVLEKSGNLNLNSMQNLQ